MPRSGTTLVCNLLNTCPHTLALGEPLVLKRDGDRNRAIEEILEFVSATRRQAVEMGAAISKHVNGVVPDNWVEEPSVLASGRRRRVLEQRGEIAVGKALNPDFHLVIKAPAEFTALADLLLRWFPLYAVVRHPLAVLASWQTVEMPVHYGHMPMMECFVPGLTKRLDAIPDRIARQIELMKFLLKVYASFPSGHVLRYEDLVDDPAIVLMALSPHSGAVTRILHRSDPELRYPGVDMKNLARNLLAIAPVAEPFYPDFTSSLECYLH
jgi:hypothetical protein